MTDTIPDHVGRERTVKTPEQIAAGLTTAMREVLYAIGDGWALAPYCGWSFRQGRTAKRLAAIGLVGMDNSQTTDGTPMFRITATGFEVRVILQEQADAK